MMGAASRWIADGSGMTLAALVIIHEDFMKTNKLSVCQKHHIGKDEGIHTLPHPLLIWQKYCPDGYKMSDVEIVHDFS